MRRTISRLSRELQVSRPRIYRSLERLGIDKKAGAEYPQDEWDLLVNDLSGVSSNNKQKKTDAETLAKSNVANIKSETVRNNFGKTICKVDAATLRERLDHAKQEYDYNKALIAKFQAETDEHYEETGKTTVMGNNGTMSAIPSIVNLDKFVKLNIALSKLITELESDLDLEVAGEEDPFS